MLDRRPRHMIAHGLDEALEPRGEVAADVGQGGAGQIDAEQIRHQRRQAPFQQQLIGLQVKQEADDPLALLHRSGDTLGKGGAGFLAA